MKHLHNIGTALKRSTVPSRTFGTLKIGLAASQWCLEVQLVPLNQDLTASGDFRQCLPVVPKASRAQIVAATISKAIFWKDIVKLKLHINMRLLSQAGQMDPEHLQFTQAFANWLLEIGDGDANSMPSHEISLPECKSSKTLLLFRS